MSGSDLLFSTMRTLHIGCAMLLVAFPLFAVFHWRPALADHDRHDKFCRTTLAVVTVALAVEVATGVAWFWLAAAAMSDEVTGAELGAVLTQTSFGLLWIVRGAFAIMLGSLLVAITGGQMVKRGAAVLAIWLALALGCGLLGSLAWAGHAASGVRWPAWHLFVDVVHLLSGAVWPIGLVPLAFFLVQRRREGAGMSEADITVVRRFSQASFFAVLALVASGAANSWLMLPSWDSLFASFYGRLLLTKVAIVAGMIVMGAINRYRFLPLLPSESSPRLARTIAVESGLAITVLFVVGVMGMTAPPS